MNSGYAVSNGNVFVSDEKGLHKRENSVNIDGILKLENMMELLNNAINEKEKSYEEAKSKSDSIKVKEIAKGVGKYFMAMGIMLCISFGVISLMCKGVSLSDLGFLSSLITYVGIPYAGVISCICFCLLGASLNEFRKNKRVSQGLEEELEYLKTYYQECSVKLQELKEKACEVGTMSQETEVVSLVDYNKQSSESVLERTKKIFLLGYYRKKLISAYEKGKLEKLLKANDFSLDETQLAEEIIGKRIAMVQRSKSSGGSIN